MKQGGVDKKTGTELYYNAGGRNAPATMNVGSSGRHSPPEALSRARFSEQSESLDPSLPVVRLRAMDEVFDEAIGRPRLLAQLLTIFAALALLLSTIGIYAVLSYMITERRREIWVRMALGATRQSVMRMVLGQGLRLTLAGIVIGIALALAGGRLIASLLFGVGPADPITIVGVVALLGTVALAACSLPGLSATRRRSDCCAARGVAEPDGAYWHVVQPAGRILRTGNGDADLADELNGHLNAHIEDNIRAGMSSDAARHEALILFGGVTQTAEVLNLLESFPVGAVQSFRFTGASCLPRFPQA